MKKYVILAALSLAAAFQPLRADEGMWLPVLITQRIGNLIGINFDRVWEGTMKTKKSGGLPDFFVEHTRIELVTFRLRT